MNWHGIDPHTTREECLPGPRGLTGDAGYSERLVGTGGATGASLPATISQLVWHELPSSQWSVNSALVGWHVCPQGMDASTGELAVNQSIAKAYMDLSYEVNPVYGVGTSVVRLHGVLWASQLVGSDYAQVKAAPFFEAFVKLGVTTIQPGVNFAGSAPVVGYPLYEGLGSTTRTGSSLWGGARNSARRDDSAHTAPANVLRGFCNATITPFPVNTQSEVRLQLQMASDAFIAPNNAAGPTDGGAIFSIPIDVRLVAVPSP